MFDFKNVGGFVFDCDGTLLDTIGAWDEAEEEFWKELYEEEQAEYWVEEHKNIF